MPQNLCSWCQEHHYSNTSFEESLDYICADCLIKLMPKTLEQTQKSVLGRWERRGKNRFPVSSEAYLRRKEAIADVAQVILLDISDGGLKLQVSQSLHVGEVLVLGFFGKEQSYKVVGKVVRRKPLAKPGDFLEVGVRIVGIHQELRNF